MRMYIYLDKDIIKCLAPKVSNISFDIDFFEYSEAYEERVNSKIDLLPFNAFEKIMKKQGSLFSAGYASNGSHRLNLFSIIISFIQFSVLLIYFAWILINKKSKKGRGRR